MSIRGLAFLGFGALLGSALLAGCGGGGSGNSRMQEIQCDDGVDQDRDGLTDCEDPDCRGTAACGGPDNAETDCSNGLDDDDDGSTDCLDRDCADSAECTGVEVCDDGTDNDEDGLTDCNDSDCADDASCTGIEICDDGTDNDQDGYTDCNDSDCSASAYCNGPEICDDGVDNDQDGYTDCGDTDCATEPGCAPADCVAGQCLCLAPGVISLPSDSLSGVLTTTDAQGGPRTTSSYYDAYEFTATAGEAATFELIDGDFDTYLYLIGPDCTSVAYNDDGGVGTLSLLSHTFTTSGTYTIVVTQYSSGTGAYTLEVRPGPTSTYEVDCGNGVDDDDDGYVDCNDGDCTGTADCIEANCANGVDDDSDGYVDCGDSDCTADAACASSSCTTGVCYCAEPTSISLTSDSVNGVLAASDATGGPRGATYYYDAYQFTASAGQTATFELVAGDFDTYLYLIDPNCTQVALNDDGGSGLLSLISYSFTTSGTYTIVVTQFGAGTSYLGAYTLQISP